MNQNNQLIAAKYTLFGSTKYWILTNHGISTDFLTETGHNSDSTTQYVDVVFDFNTMDIIEFDNTTFNDFKVDWEQLLLGKSIKKDVIFLTKNPISRFIRAIVDEKIQILGNGGVSTNVFLRKSLYKNFGKELSDEFFNWHNGKRFHELFQEDNFIPLKFKKILEQIILDFIVPVFKNDNIKECINLYYESNHTYQNLYFLHNMWFNPPTNFLKEKVSIIDIDREDILKLFNIKYGMGLSFEKDKYSNDFPYLIVRNSISNNTLYNDIEETLRAQLELWNSLIKKQYPVEIYNTTSMSPWVNEIETNNIEKRLNNYYIQNNE